MKPTKAPRICTRPGCGAFIPIGAYRCPECAQPWDVAPSTPARDNEGDGAARPIDYYTGVLVAEPAPPEAAEENRPQYISGPGMEITTSRRRRMWSWFRWVILFILVSWATVYLLYSITKSLLGSIIAVAVMLTYMIAMGWFASRNLENRSGR